MELPKNKRSRDVVKEEYFDKVAPAMLEAIENAYREGYHTGWMRAAKFYTKKANGMKFMDAVEEVSRETAGGGDE